MSKRASQKGFTILEMLLVVVIICLLAAIIFSTIAGVRRNQRNQERRRDIQDVYQQLEAYNVDNAKYPTLSDMNSPTWLKTNMKTLNKESLRDPSSKSYSLVAAPMKDAYAYQVTAADGSSCDNITKPCAHYTLTATLEGTNQGTFVKSSLN
jgi:prepilin-type N-terminal cleavage/methylation domain-containing protein